MTEFLAQATAARQEIALGLAAGDDFRPSHVAESWPCRSEAGIANASEADARRR